VPSDGLSTSAAPRTRPGGRREGRVSALVPTSASLIGHGGQAVLIVGLIDHAGHASLRSLDGSLRAEPLHACMGSGSGEPRLWTRSERSRHFRLHPSRRPRGTIRPGSDCGAVRQVMPQPPIRAGTRRRRPTCGAGRQQACGRRRRWRVDGPWSSSVACPRPSGSTTRSSA